MSIDGVQASPGQFMANSALVLFNVVSMSGINIQNTGLGAQSSPPMP
jgi:hypothetical protein